jgi:hypothetical protein
MAWCGVAWCVVKRYDIGMQAKTTKKIINDILYHRP